MRYHGNGQGWGWVRPFRLAAFLAAVVLMLPAVPCAAAVTDMEMARHMAELLGREFEPESLEVTVRDSRAYAEMRGVVLSGIRIDTMRLDALITNEDELVSDVDALASLIGYSRGEIVLLERDVNAYFDANDTRGFQNLVFDFKKEGFRADGVFSASFIVTLRIRLAATGVLGLGADGVYLENVAIFVENLRQPTSLTNQIVARVNPLIEWSDIPFKVEFKTVTMDDDAARMTGYPEKLESGSKAVWQGNAEKQG